MKVKVWNRVRRNVKKIFENNGITFCETCGSRFGLTFAHRLKRRFITDEAELAVVALLCLSCHDRIERLSHSQMYDVVTEIIESRSA